MSLNKTDTDWLASLQVAVAQGVLGLSLADAVCEVQVQPQGAVVAFL